MSLYKDIAEATELLDEDESPVKSKEIVGEIPKDRLRVWASRLGDDLDVASDDYAYVAIRCQGGRGAFEHALRIKKNDESAKASILMTECKVSYEELPPSSLVEYQFDGVKTDSGNGGSTAEQQPWRLSMVSLDYLLAFRAGKFKDWEKRMLQPSCQAEFRRMFQVGPVFSVYDHPMFPSPPEEMEHFTVTDDRTGRKLVLPRPVAALRIWSTERQAYESVDPTLDGAPITKEERESYWEQLIVKLKENFGEEEFQKMISNES
mmetsp:Transcript_26800/g.54858  ORF Transcript_26800/g.54858 Transcript_26800/m.54858 type:complete len:263 (-) Transcript_26800:205-993(-)|eukprot:CAMPEP_0183292020 /NCGR_PEP_ID=MMETSP0160_2-20130417/1246_1 /TAXON_ID=2839 ORGANISM="Odontella Sinensis, Strain Grunow 1884" /NCGR_SAMPLE_ID=MMETSP0160_2 /ASSEMBLY_ACC=CAM_ASM_000250 /LENGTH=262 /DNA_ID=CAMNT_0025452921 /DNA_START=77 /DNA_END=865 /DNA_ORIENTATION=-